MFDGKGSPWQKVCLWRGSLRIAGKLWECLLSLREQGESCQPGDKMPDKFGRGGELMS